jgi:hypothetical protein
MPYPKQKAPKGRSSSTSEFSNADPRFKSLETDPRFRLPSKKHTHTKLDKRFSRVLKDDEFSKKASVDKYGRKVDKTAGKKELKRLYQLEDESDEEDDDDEDIVKELRKADNKFDPARDGGFSESSSEEDEDEEEEDDEAVEIEEAEIPEEQGNGVPMGEISARIAVVNLDWDNIRAVDLMAVAASFAPPEGRILSVAVYPSEFGRERMEREEMEGPPKEIFRGSKAKGSEDEDEDEKEDEDSEDEDERIKKDMLREDKGEEFDSTALRNYQLDRLRYYYAIIHCSSPAVAEQIYADMDGREYLSSANFFDLRFVPDEVSFDDKPRDICDSTPKDYKPNEFVTDALTHSKVKLTWDAEDTQRKEVQKRAFSRREIDENDLQAYIGSASESDEESEDEPFLDEENDDAVSMTSKSTVNQQARRDALRAALGLGSEPSKERRRKKGDQGPVGNMQVSFTPGLSASNDTAISVFENDPRDIEETTMEKYVRRERERKQRRKEKMKAKREGRDPEEADEPATTELVEPADQGFEDPFFTDPAQAEKDAKKAHKAAKAKLRAEREAEEKLSSAKRAELELLMAGDGAEENVKHFDMREIQKAEKEKNKKGKFKNKKKGNNKETLDLNEEEAEAATADDAFQLDTKDERFERIFESHEFAIDPTNPRFKKTEGMKALLEEGRRKRARQDIEDEVGGGKKKKTKRVGEAEANAGGEVMRLVEKVKKKSRGV